MQVLVESSRFLSNYNYKHCLKP